MNRCPESCFQSKVELILYITASFSLINGASEGGRFVLCRPPEWGRWANVRKYETPFTSPHLHLTYEYHNMAFLTPIVVLAAIAYLASTYFISKKAPAGRDIPVAGTLKDLSKYPQREWRKWARQHGELFQIRLGWENWVFVNSPEAVKEIFNKQSQHTSSRAPSPVLSDLISGGMR